MAGPGFKFSYFELFERVVQLVSDKVPLSCVPERLESCFVVLRDVGKRLGEKLADLSLNLACRLFL